MGIPQKPKFIWGKNDPQDSSGSWFDTRDIPDFAYDASGAVTGLVGPDGKIATSWDRRINGGVHISKMDGSLGETVSIASTPAGGSWGTTSTSRFTSTRKITIPTQNTGGTLQINSAAGKKLCRMNSASSITVLMYLESINANDTLIVTVSADNMVNGASATRALSANKSPGYWYEVIDCSQLIGSTTLPAYIDSIRVRVARANTAGSTTVVHICGVYVNQRQKPTLLIDFDDGFRSQYQNAFPIMAAYGLVGSVAVIASAVGQSAGGLDAYDYVTLKNLQIMQNAGWGMLVHGYYPHNSAPLNSYATILADVQANKAYVEANLPGLGSKHYVLPAGQQQASTNQVLTELGFETCRATASGLQTELPDGVDNPYRLFSMGISASRTLANLKAEFDSCRKLGSTLRLFGHRIVTSVVDSGNELLDTEFEDLCAYIAPYVASGEVENLTAPAWSDRRIR